MAQMIKRTTAAGEARYDVRTRVAGRVVTRTFRRRRDADAWAATVEADKVRGGVVDPRAGRISFADYSKGWLAQRHDLRPRTIEDYRYIVDAHLLPTFGPASIGQITPHAVRQWYVGLAGRLPGRAHKAYRLLRAIMTTAVADELIARQPCQVRGAGQDRSAEREIPTVAEVDALTAAMPEHLSLAVLLAAWCGLRRGELLALRRQDVDPAHGLLRVERSMQQMSNGKLVFGPPKTEAGRRTVHFPPHLATLIEEHLATFVAPGPHSLVFTGTKGGPLRPHVLAAKWSGAREAVGVSYRFHDLRHLGATLAAATGASTRELMRRLGHASPQAALIYQHATEDRDRAIAQALTELTPLAPVTPLEPRDGRAMTLLPLSAVGGG